MKPRMQVQMRLGLEADALWQQLPAPNTQPCIDLLGQMLKAILEIERTEEASDEREADDRSS